MLVMIPKFNGKLRRLVGTVSSSLAVHVSSLEIREKFVVSLVIIKLVRDQLEELNHVSLGHVGERLDAFHENVELLIVLVLPLLPNIVDLSVDGLR